jgi:hypothetical protein
VPRSEAAEIWALTSGGYVAASAFVSFADTTKRSSWSTTLSLELAGVERNSHLERIEVEVEEQR